MREGRLPLSKPFCFQKCLPCARLDGYFQKKPQKSYILLHTGSRHYHDVTTTWPSQNCTLPHTNAPLLSWEVCLEEGVLVVRMMTLQGER